MKLKQKLNYWFFCSDKSLTYLCWYTNVERSVDKLWNCLTKINPRRISFDAYEFLSFKRVFMHSSFTSSTYDAQACE